MSVATRVPRRTSPGKLINLGAPVRSRPSDPARHQMPAALDTRLRTLLAREPGARAGEDPEEPHQMRVAVRRMRAALKAARPLLDRAWADELRAELDWLGRALGPVRDADVLIERLRDWAAGFDTAGRAAVEILIAALVTDRETARAEMLATLGSDRYTALLRRLAAAVSKPLLIAIGSAAGPALVELACTEYRRMCKAVQRAGEDPSDEVLHALRIHGRRLRYISERAATAGRKPVRRPLASTVALQDLLGEHQDACVAQHRIRQLLGVLGSAYEPGDFRAHHVGQRISRCRCSGPACCTLCAVGHGSSARRCTATPSRSSVAVSPTRTCRAPEGP
ncbi:MAG: CHAD domain-containing protein [Actinomycetota bacterium]|nr:CHAD domain-containing protein [Actinomycetota bacterium]